MTLDAGQFSERVVEAVKWFTNTDGVLTKRGTVQMNELVTT